MSSLATRPRSGNWFFVAVVPGLLGFPGIGRAAPDAAQAPHALVTASETLCQKKMPEACDQVLGLGLKATDLDINDRARLQLLLSVRRLDVSDEPGAQKAIDEALKLDRKA